MPDAPDFFHNLSYPGNEQGSPNLIAFFLTKIFLPCPNDE